MLKELQEQYRTALAAAGSFRDKYNGTKTAMSADDEQAFDKAIEDAERLDSQIKQHEKLEKLQTSSREIVDELPILAAKATSDGDKKALELTATSNLLRFGPNHLSAQDRQILSAYQADSLSGGGYTVLPQVLADMLLTKMKNLVFVREFARTFALPNADSLGVPSLDTEPAVGTWTSELLTGSEETTMALGKRELKPHPLAKLLKISNKLIRVSGQDIVNVFVDRLAYIMSVTEETAFMTGTGVDSPLGIFTASASGISTSADTTAGSSSAVAADDFINVKHDMKVQYWPNAKWVISRTVLKSIRKLKDSNNNYVWASGMGPGQGLQGNPGTLVDIPYVVSEYAPSTLTTGLYVAALCNFDFYWIADALDMQVQVVDQLYAATNQTGYIFRKETDGMPVLEEAFRRLILA